MFHFWFQLPRFLRVVVVVVVVVVVYSFLAPHGA
jgi:hypothetical protein